MTDSSAPSSFGTTAAPLTDWIAAQLHAELAPSELIVEDDSARHAGHAGAAEGSHFNLTIVSNRFNGKSRVARHRLVYDALADALPVPGQPKQLAASGKRGIHALAIAAFTPEEFATRTN